MGIVLVRILENLTGLKVEISENELVLVIKSNRKLLPLLDLLKNHSELQFKQLIDLYGVDYISRKRRFEVHYVLWSFLYNSRLRIKSYLELEEPIDSVSSLYSSGNWLEREVWDMFGIYFTNHPDLRRILTDYGFEGFPLRKDFPVTGFLEMRYNENSKRIVYEPVELSQEYRLFHFQSPWE